MTHVTILILSLIVSETQTDGQAKCIFRYILIYMNIVLYFYCEITVWNSNNLSYVNKYLCYQNIIKVYLIKLGGCHIVIFIILCVKPSYLSALLSRVASEGKTKTESRGLSLM